MEAVENRLTVRAVDVVDVTKLQVAVNVLETSSEIPVVDVSHAAD